MSGAEEFLGIGSRFLLEARSEGIGALEGAADQADAAAAVLHATMPFRRRCPFYHFTTPLARGGSVVPRSIRGDRWPERILSMLHRLDCPLPPEPRQRGAAPPGASLRSICWHGCRTGGVPGHPRSRARTRRSSERPLRGYHHQARILAR